MAFSIEIILTQLGPGRLSAGIEGTPQKAEGAEYFFYLIRYGRVVFRSGWISKSQYEFHIDESGAYAVQGHVRHAGANINKKSQQVFVMAADDDRSYQKWCSSTSSEFTLPFYRAKYPFTDMLLDVTGLGDATVLSDLGLVGHAAPTACIDGLIYSSAPPRNASGREVYFSGVAKVGRATSLTIGDLDIGPEFVLDDAVGAWTAIVASDETIKVMADLGGVCRWYRLRVDGAEVLSNNYHLLLIYAARVGLKLALSQREVLASLAFTGLQPLHQLYGRNLPVDGVQMVPPDRYIQVSSAGELSECYTPLRSALEFSPKCGEEIATLKAMAVDEIAANLEVVLSDPRFTRVICDLSGGLDSRTVFSALTSRDDGLGKVVIHARESVAEPVDHVVACRLNSFYGLPYDDLSTVVSPNGPDIPWSDHWSFYLGTYYSYRAPIMKKKHDADVIRLVGFYGEVCLRNYYTRFMRGGELDVDGIDEFISRYFDKYAAASLIVAPGLVDAAKDVLAESLVDIPGARALDRFENHYVYYRNGLHTSPVVRSEYSALEWGPLQSLSALKVKAAGVGDGISFQLDLIGRLNPLLAQVPYQSDADEQGRLDFEYRIDDWLGNVDMDVEVDLSEWRAASMRKKEHEVRMDMAPEFYVAAREDKQRMLDRALEALLYVRSALGPTFDPVARSLWYIITSSKGTSYGGQEINCVNRIVSLAAQLTIIRSARKVRGPDRGTVAA